MIPAAIFLQNEPVICCMHGDFSSHCLHDFLTIILYTVIAYN